MDFARIGVNFREDWRFIRPIGRLLETDVLRQAAFGGAIESQCSAQFGGLGQQLAECPDCGLLAHGHEIRIPSGLLVEALRRLVAARCIADAQDIIHAHRNERGGTVLEDGYRESIDVIGSGQAYIFEDGSGKEVTWSKPTKAAQITFTDASGNDVPLARGQTWITAVPENRGGGVTWQ